jgi:Response regulators consisting of a CheY-like receiver domain and a winged-helix DNA-binding domain
MSKKILIADDEEELVELLTYFLESEGYAVVPAFHGRGLPALIAKEKPGLILLDANLPGMDGHTLLLQLAGTEDSAIPVIVISGMAAARSQFEELKQARYFLEKPFDPPVLLSKIKELLGE